MGRHLGWGTVRNIRAEYAHQAGRVPPARRKQLLAWKYRVSLRTVQRIIAGHTWRVQK